VEIALKRYDNAISDLNQVIGLSDDEVNAYTLFQSYEAQAIAFTETNDLNAAEHSIRDAVKRLPTFRAALTDKLAIILYNSGRKEQAYTELKAAREAADWELLPASKAIFFRLGVIETELGDQSAARADLQHFLSVTSSFSNPETDLQRRQAIAELSKLK
jgi:tetratricopeptide (TPR) repeat protein